MEASMLESPTAPIWVTLVTPAIAALATWITTKFEIMSVHRIKQYEGTWYAYYRDPDSKEMQEELWRFSMLGAVTVSRNGKRTFKGRLTLKGNKAYMNVDSTISTDERLFVMLDTPNSPRTGDQQPSLCIWLGKSADHTTTAGHGVLSREKLTSPGIKDEFIRAR
jgi:hypothetical protein